MRVEVERMEYFIKQKIKCENETTDFLNHLLSKIFSCEKEVMNALPKTYGELLEIYKGLNKIQNKVKKNDFDEPNAEKFNVDGREMTAWEVLELKQKYENQIAELRQALSVFKIRFRIEKERILHYLYEKHVKKHRNKPFRMTVETKNHPSLRMLSKQINEKKAVLEITKKAFEEFLKNNEKTLTEIRIKRKSTENTMNSILNRELFFIEDILLNRIEKYVESIEERCFTYPFNTEQDENKKSLISLFDIVMHYAKLKKKEAYHLRDITRKTIILYDGKLCPVYSDIRGLNHAVSIKRGESEGWRYGIEKVLLTANSVEEYEKRFSFEKKMHIADIYVPADWVSLKEGEWIYKKAKTVKEVLAENNTNHEEIENAQKGEVLK